MYKNFDDFLLSLNKDETIDGTSEIVDKIMETVTIPEELFDTFAAIVKAQSASTSIFVLNLLKQYHEWLLSQE